jgi:SAM-dependent methyltransferase
MLTSFRHTIRLILNASESNDLQKVNLDRSVRSSTANRIANVGDGQSPDCPLCGSRDGKALFSQRGYKLISCPICELFFIQPYPQDFDRHHEIVSDYGYEDLEILDTGRHYEDEVVFYDKYFGAIDQECKGATSVLDVGCGCGHLLEKVGLRTTLYRVGIELNRRRAEMARKVAQCEIFEVPIEKFSSTRRFDVITLMNVLSHVPSINHLFIKVRSLLTEQGKVILKVGEMRRNVLKSAAFDWGIPDHLHFLGLGTLEYLCEKYGFWIETRERIIFSEELFAPYAWKMKGRSAGRNAIKRGVVRVPFALPFLARCYEFIHQKSIFSSFVVLRVSSQNRRRTGID